MLKGMDAFIKKVPALKGPRIGFVPLFAVAALVLAFAVMLGFDAWPGLFVPPSPLAAFLPLAGVCLVGLLGLALVWQMWFRRDRLKKKYGARSYSRIFSSDSPASAFSSPSLSISSFPAGSRRESSGTVPPSPLSPRRPKPCWERPERPSSSR